MGCHVSRQESGEWQAEGGSLAATALPGMLSTSHNYVHRLYLYMQNERKRERADAEILPKKISGSSLRRRGPGGPPRPVVCTEHISRLLNTLVANLLMSAVLDGRDSSSMSGCCGSDNMAAW